jgi:hypothetical protein
MANTIITKNSATATAVPTAGQLVQGELAVNVTDKRLFTENSGGTVVEVGTNPSTIAVAGNATVGGTLGVTGLATLASSTLTANPTLSAGTANGVTYLNGSKVLTSGSGLTTNGNSLGVGSSDFGGAGSINVSVGVAGTTTGGLQLWSTTTGQHYVQFGDGTAGAATYAGAIGYSHATDQMFFYANAAEQMRLTSTGLGIGTSSPQVQLHLQSDAPVIRLTDTTANTNAEIFCNSAAGSMYLRADKDNTAANSVIGFQIDGSDKMTLDSSGNLGLGVSPSAWISAYKGFDIGTTTSLYGRTDSTMEFALALNGYRASSGSWLYRNNGAAARYNQNSGTHWWDVAPSGTAGNAISFTQAMTLDASGQLGIGATSPSATLDIVVPTGTAKIKVGNNTLAGGSYLNLQGASGSKTWFVASNYNIGGALEFIQSTANGGSTPAGTASMLIESSGNVGIGGPVDNHGGYGRCLQISGIEAALELESSSGYSYVAQNGVDLQIRNVANGTMPFYTNSTERMRIDSAGSLLVNTTAGYGKFTVASTAGTGKVLLDNYATVPTSENVISIYADASRGYIQSYNNGYKDIAICPSGGGLVVGTTSNSRGARLRVEGLETAHFTGYGNGYGIGLWMTPNPSATGGTATPVSFQNVSDATVGSITTTASATAYNTSSDYRLKEDWVAVADASTRVNALKPVNFAWKVNGSRVDGFLAHELADVVPEAVTGTKDAVDAEGKPVYQGIDQSKLVPLLTAALQEALAKIELLTARVSALEGN